MGDGGIGVVEDGESSTNDAELTDQVGQKDKNSEPVNDTIEDTIASIEPDIEKLEDETADSPKEPQQPPRPVVVDMDVEVVFSPIVLDPFEIAGQGPVYGTLAFTNPNEVAAHVLIEDVAVQCGADVTLLADAAQVDTQQMTKDLFLALRNEALGVDMPLSASEPLPFTLEAGETTEFVFYGTINAYADPGWQADDIGVSITFDYEMEEVLPVATETDLLEKKLEPELPVEIEPEIEPEPEDDANIDDGNVDDVDDTDDVQPSEPAPDEDVATDTDLSEEPVEPEEEGEDVDDSSEPAGDDGDGTPMPEDEEPIDNNNDETTIDNGDSASNAAAGNNENDESSNDDAGNDSAVDADTSGDSAADATGDAGSSSDAGDSTTDSTSTPDSESSDSSI